MKSAALLILFAAGAAGAVELEPGVAYEGPKRLKASEVGVSVKIPAGWRAQLPPGGDTLIVGHDTVAGGIFVRVERASRDEVTAFLSNPIPVDDMGTLAVPSGAPRVKGDRITVDYRVGDGMPGHAIARVHADGRAVAVLGVGPKASFAKVKKVVKGLAASVKFTKVKKPKAPKAAKSSGFWAKALRGKKIHRFFSGSGYSEHRTMTLCSDGSYFSSFDGGGFTPGVASGAVQSKGAGTWAASGTKSNGTLTITLHDGRTTTYSLAEEGGKLYVDGKKWLREGGGC